MTMLSGSSAKTCVQELFAKLTRIASIASDMFVGRERFATVLLMRLTETVILWLSDDQSFWEEIEEGPRPLGPLGLQQVFLFLVLLCTLSFVRGPKRSLRFFLTFCSFTWTWSL